MAKNIRAALPNLVANSRRANSPLPILLVGAALLAFWILATVLQIQTSEAFILKGPAVTAFIVGVRLIEHGLTEWSR